MRASLFWLVSLTATLVGTSGLWKGTFAETAIQATSTQLVLNKVFERSLAGGGRDRYEIAIEQGQYIHIKTEQRGVDVILSFYGMDGSELLQIDTPNGVKGFETLDFVASQTGKYQLVVAALDPNAKKGQYRASLTEQRKSRSSDAEKITSQENLISAAKAENRASDLLKKGSAAEAEPLLREALLLRQKVPGSPYLSQALSLLASVYEAQGKNDLALQSCEEAMPQLEKEEGKRSSTVGYLLYRIGRFYLGQDNLSQAEPKLRRAVQILATLPEVPPETLMVARQTLASLYKTQKKFPEAQTQYGYALEIAAREQRGPENPDYAYLLNEAGEVYLEQKSFTAAADAFRKAWAICDNIKPDPELSIRVLLNLVSAKNVQAILAREQNNFGQAEASAREGLELLKQVAGFNRKESEAESLKFRALLLNRLAEIFLARNDDTRKDIDAATGALQDALAICEKVLPESTFLATVLTNLGDSHYKHKDYAHAESALQRAIALHVTNKSLPAESFKPKYLLAQLFLEQDNAAQAEPLLLEARHMAADNPALMAEIDSHLGKLYTKTEDFRPAESYLRQALSFYQKNWSNSFVAAAVWGSLGRMYKARGSLVQAESCFSRAVGINRKNSALEQKLSPAHLALTLSLSDLGILYIERGDFARAEQVIGEVKAVAALPLAENYGIAISIGTFGAAYTLRGQFARAEALLRESLSHAKPQTVEAAIELLNLGILYTSTADYGRAEDCLKQALAIFEADGKDSIYIQHSLSFLAEMYRQQGRYSLAMAQADRLLALFEQKYGPNHLEVAKGLDDIAKIYIASNDYNRAELLFRRKLEIMERLRGPEDPGVAEALSELCMVSGLKGDYSSLRPARERGIAILKKAQRQKPLNSKLTVTLVFLYIYGFNDVEIQEGAHLLEESLAREDAELGTFMIRMPKLLLLGQQLSLLGDFARAEKYYREALKSAEQSHGRVSLGIILILKGIADFFAGKADYVEAAKFYAQALDVQKKLFNPRHPGVADLLTSLADLDKQRGDYVAPERNYREALDIRTSIFGAVSNQVIESETKLADLYRDRGEFGRAEELYQKALASAKQLDGANTLPVLNAYFGLATMYRNKEEYDQAETYFRKTQAIVEEIFGKTSLFMWGIGIIPARIYLQHGDYVKAQLVLQQALAFRRKVGAPNDLSESYLRLNLAETFRVQEAYSEAESLGSEALTIRENLLGPDHPDTIQALEGMADTRLAQGRFTEAIRLRTLAAERAEKNITNLLASGSERQKSELLATFNKSTDAIVSLHLKAAPNNLDAKRLALTTILRRKGRALDVFSDQVSILRRRASPEDQVLFDQLGAASTRWTNLVFKSAAQGEEASRPEALRNFGREAHILEEEIQRLEAALSSRSAEFRNQTQPITIEAVRAVLSANTALVEFIAYRPYNVRAIGYKNKFGSTRYAAYVLTSDSAEPGVVELGDAQSIDALVLEWRALLGRRADEKEITPKGNSLYLKVFAPLTRLLSNHKHVLLVPDGNLNLIQFAALVDAEGRYLIDDYNFSYLTSGRELLRLQKSFPSESAMTLIADPAFDLTEREVICPPEAGTDNIFDFTQRCYKSLPGTAQEAKELSQLFPDAQVSTGPEATEANLKKVRRPRFLHVATHGFFSPDPTSAKPLGLVETGKQGAQQMNPMARSGLIMAGVKQGLSGAGEDGVLTAQEVVSLNLLGTKLAVLSACETGLGDAQNGQGVYGLRRALVLAGSETQIMSLWKVSDNATRALMVAYYKRLHAGEGRAEALVQVQLAMLHGKLTPAIAVSSGQRETSDTGSNTVKDYRHPYYWAAFIQSGDWRSMDGK